ncbi:type II toxin-antitoxin system HipA family toxin [Sulfuriferula thiophila]|uniref:type II toxin-antitoxin system HipA family toxin n=1 Tax=Sulfuriferula thiophila TaxID=1781211 RepID=UPI000F60A45D|nr:type II toxin-antitoxin system HipA family toxin [Sulfuriferula thiophila]
MAATTTSLYVFAHIDGEFAPAGKLNLAEHDQQTAASTFTYGLRYIERPNAIEIDPVGLSLKPIENVTGKLLVPPNGLSFFGGIRDAAPDAWGRRLIEARLRVPANSLPESAYLLGAGSDRAGALDIRTSLDAPAQDSRGSAPSLEYLLEAAERVESGLPVPDRLSDIFIAGTGLGGMRPKVSIRDSEHHLWLAKFPSIGDSLIDIPLIEHATLRLAALAGLAVPETKIIRVLEKNVMLIRRFDRSWTTTDKPAEIRHHMISALTLLACEESDSPNKSYMDIVSAMRRYCGTAYLKADIAELYARMVFNILVSNDDDHLRNHAFLRDPGSGEWRLSPLYDVMPRAGLASERFLHLGVGAKGRLADLDNAYSAKERFGLLAPDACAIIDRVWRVVRQWQLHFEAFDVPAEQIARISPAFRHIDDVSSPELRKQL